MIDAQMRRAVFALHQEGMGLREITRRLHLGRNTVRRIIRESGEMPESVRTDKIQVDVELLRRLYRECEGRAQRVHEKLVEEEGLEVSYPTLTRMLRELEIGARAKRRCAQVPDEPGAEMQHDTTVYPVKLDGKPTRLVASLMYLRYSKRRYLKFYRGFNRFQMKCFFHETLRFWGYAARRCIIDNTNLARLRGTGAEAVIVPEMAAFARQYGFAFRCHEKGHANRKAGEERSFWTVETNFLPGRTFRSLEDLNAQAFDWATVRQENRPQGKARLIPARAFAHECEYLIELPTHLPEPYQPHERGTDQYGYVAFEGNYYWVPGTRREPVKVLRYAQRLQLYRGRECLAEYPLPADGLKNRKFAPPGQPPPAYSPSNRRRPTQEEEKRLRALDERVDRYLDFALAPKGITRHQFLRRLFALSQQMSPAVFIPTLERAHRYRIVSIDTIRSIALLYLNEPPHSVCEVPIDPTFTTREAYLEGRLTDAPDFTAYDQLLEEGPDE